MPLYDCGSPDCEECQQAFGPDRSKAIAAYEARGKSYYLHDLPPEENAIIDAAWKRHIAVVPGNN